MAQDSSNDSDVVIWRNLSVGAADAEADKDLLTSCFIDTGVLDEVLDVAKHPSILLGRTGCGKSAILQRTLQVESGAAEIIPMRLALKFVENSTVIRSFESAGVNLDLFYRLLWRHVLLTELLKKRFDLRDKSGFKRWIDSFFRKFSPNSPEARALEYLRSWGEEFWETTEVRLRELTNKVEEKLVASVAGTVSIAKVKGEGSNGFSEQERTEIVTRGSSIINSIQVREMHDLLDFLEGNAFHDDQKSYYLLIDQIDEDWVSEKYKLRLIRALLEEIRSLRKISSLKVLVAMRQDLLDKVFDETRDGGFQQEKFEQYLYRITWLPEELKTLIDRRISEVFRRKYTGRRVTAADVFPRIKGGQSPFDFMIERSFRRPRDILLYVNECCALARERSRISWRTIHEAESLYSRKRLQSLLDEWLSRFPSLIATIEMLRGMPESFQRSAISKEDFNQLASSLAELHDAGKADKITTGFHKFCTDPSTRLTESDLVFDVLQQLYHVGAVGLKCGPEESMRWSYLDSTPISRGEVKRSTQIRIHKMLWKALGVRTNLALQEQDGE